MNRNDLFWTGYLALLIAMIALFGFTYHGCTHLKLIPAPYAQESFTVPLTDGTFNEMAAVGPESEIDNG